MDEPRLAKAARAYIEMLEHQQDMRPPNWSQEDHTREHYRRLALLEDMRDALGAQS